MNEKLLQLVMSLSPQIAQRLMSIRSTQELQELLAECPELGPAMEQLAAQAIGSEQMALVKMVNAFVFSDSWIECKRVVETHPELLTDNTDAILAMMAKRQTDSSAKDDVEEHRRLLARCRTQGIDAAFGDLMVGLEGTPKGFDPELLMRLKTTHSKAEMEKLLTEHPELMPISGLMKLQRKKTLQQGLEAFMKAGSRAETKRVIETHPELLTDETAAIMEQLIANSEEHKNEAARYFFDQHRQLLKLCRTEGVEAAFTSQVLGRSGLLRDVDPKLLTRLNSIHNNQELLELVKEYPELTMFVKLVDFSPEKRQAELEKVVRDFVHADTWAESKLIVQAHPELLTDEADALLLQMIDTQRNASATHSVREHHQMLARCRVEGIEAAFADHMADRSDMQQDLPAKLLMRLGSVLSKQDEQEIAELLIERPELMGVLMLDLFRGQGNLGKTPIGSSDRDQQKISFDRMSIPQRFLGHLNRLRRLPKTGAGIEQQILILEDILRALPQDEAPLFWGTLQKDLAIFYDNRATGNRTENRERAMAARTAALEVITQEDFPIDWAEIQYNLGVDYIQATRGDRAENLERAIAAYTAALQVYNSVDFPVDWADTQTELGDVLRERIHGDRAENLERAIAAYTAALQVKTRMQYPVDWARIQNNLGVALRERIHGDRAENLERAIAAYNGALEVRTRANYPSRWASTQINLGNALCDRIHGDRAENLEQAIVAYTAVLEASTQSGTPVQWAMAQNGLGNAYTSRIHGDRAENLERAIAAYTRALEVRTRADFPVAWAKTQNNLGTVYLERIHGELVANLELALDAFKAALEVRIRSIYPVDWATTQCNIGIAYGKRICGDRAENLERAIAAFIGALEVFTPADSLREWARTQNNLGNAYLLRIDGSRAENIERAITVFNAVLNTVKRNDAPEEWAMVQGNLGNALRQRTWGDEAENQERAIAAYAAALQVKTRADFPAEWAVIQGNLGIIYLERIRGERAENLAQAINALTTALQVVNQSSFPMEWVRTQHNLGNAHTELMRDTKTPSSDECKRNMEAAIAAYSAAIEGAHAIGMMDEKLISARSLGNLYYDEGQWALAHSAFDIAIASLESIRTAYFTDIAKNSLLTENAQLYTRMTDVCLILGLTQEALEHTEASKGRLFLDQLGYDALPLPPLPAAQRPLLEKEARLVGELRAIENAIRVDPGKVRQYQLVTQQSERRAALDEVWARLDSYAPDYVALRRGKPARYQQLQAVVDSLSTSAALIEFYTLPTKVVIFVVRSGEREPAVVYAQMPQDRIRRCLSSYLREVVAYPLHGNIGQRWQELAGPLVTGILPHLIGVDLVYVVPHGFLHYLPLHALQIDGDYLIDRFPIAYIPSAAILGRIVQRTAGRERTGQLKALVAGNPTLNLRFAESEATQIAQVLHTQAYLGQTATKSAIAAEIEGKDIVHLAGHGYFHPTLPLQSGMLFAGEEVLTAQEIMGLNLQADLFTLSACKTGLSQTGTGDELVGLTRALLYGGASSALVSQWAVDDASTGRLMTDFYSRLYDQEGHKIRTKVAALREAMLEMRKQQGHPYHWAPFILVGDWR